MNFQWRVLDRSSETSTSYGRYLKGVLSDYLRSTDCKRLLAQIRASQERAGFKTLAVISENPGDGRSFLVLVLAFSYAMLLGKRVLVIDAVSQTEGRTLYLDRLTGDSVSPVIRSPDAQEGIIDLLSTRTEREDHLECSDFQIGAYVDGLKGRYDLVLYDTCAILGAGRENIDPLIIGRKVDSAIVVLNRKSFVESSLRKVKGMIEQANIRLIGAVYNGGLQ